MKDRIIAEMQEICSQYPQVNKALLFGSRARGDNGERSDYDIAIYMDSDDYCSLLNEVDEIETLLKIDVTIIREGHGLSDLFISNVEREGVVIYG